MLQLSDQKKERERERERHFQLTMSGPVIEHAQDEEAFLAHLEGLTGKKGGVTSRLYRKHEAVSDEMARSFAMAAKEGMYATRIKRTGQSYRAPNQWPTWDWDSMTPVCACPSKDKPPYTGKAVLNREGQLTKIGGHANEVLCGEPCFVLANMLRHGNLKSADDPTFNKDYDTTDEAEVNVKVTLQATDQKDGDPYPPAESFLRQLDAYSQFLVADLAGKGRYEKKLATLLEANPDLEEQIEERKRRMEAAGDNLEEYNSARRSLRECILPLARSLSHTPVKLGVVKVGESVVPSLRAASSATFQHWKYAKAQLNEKEEFDVKKNARLEKVEKDFLALFPEDPLDELEREVLSRRDERGNRKYFLNPLFVYGVDKQPLFFPSLGHGSVVIPRFLFRCSAVKVEQTSLMVHMTHLRVLGFREPGDFAASEIGNGLEEEPDLVAEDGTLMADMLGNCAGPNMWGAVQKSIEEKVVMEEASAMAIEGPGESRSRLALEGPRAPSPGLKDLEGVGDLTDEDLASIDEFVRQHEGAPTVEEPADGEDGKGSSSGSPAEQEEEAEEEGEEEGEEEEEEEEEDSRKRAASDSEEEEEEEEEEVPEPGRAPRARGKAGKPAQKRRRR